MLSSSTSSCLSMTPQNRPLSLCLGFTWPAYADRGVARAAPEAVFRIPCHAFYPHAQLTCGVTIVPSQHTGCRALKGMHNSEPPFPTAANNF